MCLPHAERIPYPYLTVCAAQHRAVIRIVTPVVRGGPAEVSRCSAQQVELARRKAHPFPVRRTGPWIFSFGVRAHEAACEHVTLRKQN